MLFARYSDMNGKFTAVKTQVLLPPVPLFAKSNTFFASREQGFILLGLHTTKKENDQYVERDAALFSEASRTSTEKVTAERIGGFFR